MLVKFISLIVDLFWTRDFFFYIFGVLAGWFFRPFWPGKKSQDDKEAP